MKYIYVVYAFLIFAGLFLALFPLFLLMSLFGSLGRKANWYLIKLWSELWFPLVGIFSKNIYNSHPDPRETYIVVANHASYLDTPLIFKALSFFVRPIGTYEYSKIPLFGFLYRNITVVIDRENNRSKVEGINGLRQTLKEGSSIFIFPEGKFNTGEEPLLPFFDGAFRLSVQNDAPILPLVFLDTSKRWSNKSFWSLKPGRNRVVVLPALFPADFGNDAQLLKACVRENMLKTIKQYQ